MAKIKREELDGDEPPVVIPEVTDAPPTVAVEAGPIPIVDLEDVIQAESLSPAEQQAGVKFWFGEVGVLTFPDQSVYHIRNQHAFITDPALIAKLKAHAEQYPTSKIFIQ